MAKRGVPGKGGPGPALLDILADLRAAIEESQKELGAEGKPPLFRFVSVEVEVNFVVEEEKGGQAGAHWLFLTVGGQAKYSNQQVHKLKMVLKAVPGKDIVAGASSGPPQKTKD